jgi:RNA polymerase sigma-70 factor (ECF subfamily)
LAIRFWSGVAPPAVDEIEFGAASVNDDEALVARAQADPRAFAPLYRRYAQPVYGYCYRRLGTRELAEDATSQVFTKALAALPRYRGDTFRPCLFTIAHHVVADVYRRRKPTAPLDDAWQIADGAVSPEDEVIAADDARNVRRLLSQLTPDQRDVVELRLNCLTGVEIAEVLGKRPGAIRAIQFRAYQRLRELLSNEGERS